MADALKDEGNKLFQAGDFLKAAATYTQAIKLDADNAVLYSNRSAALLKLKKVTKAVEDADKCIQLKPDWEKGYFRKGAILEDQGKLSEALNVYQTALSLVPDSKELALKIRTLTKLVKVKSQQASSQATSTATGSATKADTAAAPDLHDADPVYEDLGSEEVAAFAEEYLGLLADEVRDTGSDFIPMVHFLPGRPAKALDEEQQHVRGAGAFESPATLQGFVDFLRAGAEKLEAQAMFAFIPKRALGYPQTWLKSKWPCGDEDGVFAQLESQQMRKLWFVPVIDKKPGSIKSIDADAFGPLPKVLRAW